MTNHSMTETCSESRASDTDAGAGPAPRPRTRTLTETARRLLEAPDHERIAHIERDKFIPYEAGNKILDRMERLLDHQIVSRPLNLLILAAPNNGKSTILEEFFRRHSGSDNIDESALHMPVILVPAPSEARKIEFEDEMLRQLRIDPKNTVDKKSVICSRLQRYRTRVIAIDEVSMLLAGSPMNQRKVMNDVRYISNKSKASIVMAGAKEMINVLMLDEHAKRRFPPLLIKRWTPRAKDFRQFLFSYEATLPLKHASNLHTMSELIYELTEGLMGDVVQLVKDSAVEAIKRRSPDTEFIDQDLLRQCRIVRNVTEAELAAL